MLDLDVYSRVYIKIRRQLTRGVHATQHVTHVLDVKTEACMCVKPQPVSSKHIQDKYITSLSR